MNIKILSRTKAVKLSYTDFEKDKVIISIRDPWAEKAQFNDGNSSIKEILYLSFYDISEETKDIFDGYSSMSPDDALKIAHFVNKWKDKVDTIWVHCEVGVSRSAGIAMAIMEYLNLDLAPIFENPIYCPNMLCYELTNQAFKNQRVHTKNDDAPL
ncbi:MAG: dual specificity protein phosphatase family protein [Eubacterium sp.]|nr:dual specificity protein phosphatase family protein [Eubacterium sp.]